MVKWFQQRYQSNSMEEEIVFATNVLGQMDTHTQRHTHIDTQTHRHTQIHTDTHTQTHTHIQTHTHRDTKWSLKLTWMDSTPTQELKL